jgi:hypothetical protein
MFIASKLNGKYQEVQIRIPERTILKVLEVSIYNVYISSHLLRLFSGSRILWGTLLMIS